MTSDPELQLSAVPNDDETPWYPTCADVAEAIAFGMRDGYPDRHDLSILDTCSDGWTLLLRVGDGVFPAVTGVMEDGGFFRVRVERIGKKAWDHASGESADSA